MRDKPGLDSARALLVGLEVPSVSFVRNWVELLLEDEVRVAAFTALAGYGPTSPGSIQPIFV